MKKTSKEFRYYGLCVADRASKALVIYIATTCFIFWLLNCQCSQETLARNYPETIKGNWDPSVNGIANPFLGIGFFIACADGDCEARDMLKISDDWTPPGD